MNPISSGYRIFLPRKTNPSMSITAQISFRPILVFLPLRLLSDFVDAADGLLPLGVYESTTAAIHDHGGNPVPVVRKILIDQFVVAVARIGSPVLINQFVVCEVPFFVTRRQYDSA